MSFLILKERVKTPHCVRSQARRALEGVVSFQARVRIPAGAVGAARAFPERINRIFDIRIAIGDERGLGRGDSSNGFDRVGKATGIGVVRCRADDHGLAGEYGLRPQAQAGKHERIQAAKTKMRDYDVGGGLFRANW